MQFHAIAIALFSAILAARATPVANPNHDAACNKDWSPDACGACHYWRQCLDSRTDEWISPCPACDNTSWCNCTAPAGHNDLPNPGALGSLDPSS